MKRVALMCMVIVSCQQAIPAQSPRVDDKGVELRVEAMLGKLTLEQKIALIGGQDSFYIRAEPEIGLPQLKMSDASAGVRTWGPTTAYAAPIALAATWDTALAADVGEALGKDSRARGVAILLAPGVNIARAPMAGRSFEYLGEDPYLTSRLAVAYIRGVQSEGVCATVKHFMMNNEEYDRHDVSSNADERTMREIYMPAFEAAVKEGDVCAIMNSYNPINGVHATQNSWMNNQVAKQEWGFKGIIMSDWESVYDGVAAANGGLDLEMPFAKYMTAEKLLPAVRSGAVSQEVIDDKVRRILREAVRFGFTDRAQTLDYPLDSDEHNELALREAQEGIVLLKNVGSLLPLKAERTCKIALIGPNVYPSVIGGGGSSLVESFRADNIFSEMYKYLLLHAPKTKGCEAKVLYDSGTPSIPEIFGDRTFDRGLQRTVVNAAGSNESPTVKAVEYQTEELSFTVKKASKITWDGEFTIGKPGDYYLAISSKAGDNYYVTVNGKVLPVDSSAQVHAVHYVKLPETQAGKTESVHIDLVPSDTEVRFGIAVRSERQLVSNNALEIASQADAVICMVGFDKSVEREGRDRTFALPWSQDALIREISSINKNTVVTVNSGGNVDMTSWLQGIPALLELWYPGQAGGKALTNILFGVANPEGKLPVTFEKQWTDNPTHDSYYPQKTADSVEKHVDYAEGVFVGYRFFAGADLRPQFPFGFGLSYSHFAFSNLHLDRDKLSFGNTLTVTVDVKNVSELPGAEVVQLYLGDPSAKLKRPVRELKAFTKVRLNPGESKKVSFLIEPRAFSYWGEKQKGWVTDPGEFVVYVGDSSEATPLRATLTMQ